MAIENFGIATSTTGAVQDSIRVTADSAPSALYIRWHTIEAVGTIKAFDIAVSCRRVKRGGRGVSEPQYGDWSDWYYEQVAIASCNPSQDSTGYSYYHTFDINGMYAAEGLSGGFGFANRVNDQMDFQLKIKAIYEDAWAAAYNGGVNYSAVTFGYFWLGYVPTYSVASASFDGTGDLKITFSRPNWTRTDDVVCISNVEIGGIESLGKKATFTVGAGVIKIPSSYASRLFKAGTASITFAVYATYKPREFSLFSGTAGVTIADLSVSSTPKVSVTVDGTRLYVGVSDYADKPVKSAKWIVRLLNYSADGDTQVLSKTGGVYFYFPPLGTLISVQVQGFSADGTAKSAIFQKSITIPCPATAVFNTISEDGKFAYGNPEGFNLYYGASSKRQITRDINVIKLAGRERASAYFGAGAEVTETLSGNLIDLKGLENGVAATLEKIAANGTVLMLRKANGYRHKVVLTKVVVSRGCVSPVLDVQLTVQEVG